MNKFKRFSQAELQAYIADHPVIYDSEYKSEPHTVIMLNPDFSEIVSIPIPIKKKKK